MRSIVAASIMAAALAAGCAATVTADAYGPDLVTVSPGVQVIADYDEPIFYSDGFYWRYYGNTWYRSTYYTGGWVYAQPPVAVMRIDRPYAYRYYRPQGWVGHSHYNQPRTYGVYLGQALVLAIDEDVRIERTPVPVALRTRMAPIVRQLKLADGAARRALTDAVRGDSQGMLAELRAIAKLSPSLNTRLDRAGLRDCGSNQD